MARLMRKNKLSENARKRLIDALLAGTTASALSERFGVGRGAVYYHLHLAGYRCTKFMGRELGRWERLGPVLLVCAMLAGCMKPQPRADIPPPVGANTYLVYDGKQLIWRELVGGPSGAIDTASHPGEIELVPVPTAKYIRSPVSLTGSAAPGQLVVYGPSGSQEQVIEASSASIPLLAIENGILKAAVTSAGGSGGRTVFGWTGDTYVRAGATVFAAFGSAGFAGATNRVFVMPSAGIFKSLFVTTRGTQNTSGVLQISLARNGAPIIGPPANTPPLEVTVPAGGQAAVRMAFRDVKVEQSDLIQIMLVNTANANSAYINAITAVFEF